MDKTNKQTKQGLLEEILILKQQLKINDDLIAGLINTKVNIEKEVKETYVQNNFFNKVNQNIYVSEKRMGMCFDILNVQGEDYKAYISDENYKLANSVLTNELEKIHRQQLKELEVSLTAKY